LLSLNGEDSRITRFLQESLHTNPFRKIPDYNSRQFTFFKQYFTKSVGPGRFSAENLKVESRNDRMTDELIWGGLGNLRFLQARGGIFCSRAINNLIVAGRCILRTNLAQHTRRSIKHIEPWRPPSYHGSHGAPLPAPMRRNISQ
jgi:hypothetical protein